MIAERASEPSRADRLARHDPGTEYEFHMWFQTDRGVTHVTPHSPRTSWTINSFDRHQSRGCWSGQREAWLRRGHAKEP
jgi:hypothetical protein